MTSFTHGAVTARAIQAAGDGHDAQREDRCCQRHPGHVALRAGASQRLPSGGQGYEPRGAGGEHHRQAHAVGPEAQAMAGTSRQQQ